MPKRKQPARNEEAKKAKAEEDAAPENLEWDVGDGNSIPPFLAMFSTFEEGRSKVAGFDIDWTIIATASGKKFATGAKDWKFWNEAVPKKLKSLHEDGFRVVFFSNQGGIEKGKATINELKTKVSDIVKKCGIPIYAYLGTGENHYRKPSPEIWNYFINNHNNGVKVDLSKSIYVGDAAGRAKNWAPGKPKDFSCTDRMFAANVGIDFKTPEEFFLGEKAVPFQWGSWDVGAAKFGAGTSENYASENQELVLMVGMPASGKSSFSKKHFVPKGYVHVNRDTLGTPAKCLKAAEEGLKNKKSVVVDNTNPTKSARADYINLAKKNKVPVRCFVMETSKEIAHHLNYVRQNMTEGQVRRIPDVGYAVFNKNFEEPSTQEGFSSVKTVSFIPSFENDRHKQLFHHWTA